MDKQTKVAWEYYKKWREEETFSPALNSNINITRMGWNHLINKNRSHSDLKRRLKLLSKARALINLSTTIQNIRKIGDQKYIAMEHIFSLNSKRKVRVILKTRDLESFTFLSVMDRKI